MQSGGAIRDAMNVHTQAARCPRCGRPLPASSPEGLCPSCLLLEGAETFTTTSPGADTTVLSGQRAGARTEETWLFAPNSVRGPYRIGRLLGRGGMGEVYEAEQVESGRRVALKILRSQLRTGGDRARFLREGQLAASVSHPHTVYIFGSEEIDGFPVISMELAPGGTLKDRVTTEGPLPIVEAVSAVLDIIGGLDAAQVAGILHRDIKPSNCFIDADGSVKVGDFGLSISTLARDVAEELETGVFQGTPQFAAPEQLRGEPLDVRADIYAVGATLYYLLTGHLPFEARDLRDLVAQVTTEPAKPPRLRRPDLPGALDAIVLRCLAKTPSERPSSYAALADALRPFAARQEEPARLSTRFVAAAIDMVILQVPTMAWRAFFLQTEIDRSSRAAAATEWVWVLSVGYYFSLEGFWGASLGKRILGLRVASIEERHWWRRIAIRTIVFYAPAAVLALAAFLIGPSEAGPPRLLGPNVAVDDRSLQSAVMVMVSLALSASIFLSARRRNGWAGLHELASGTRVVRRLAAADKRATVRPDAAAPMASTSGDRRCGPFGIVAEAGRTDTGRLFRGFDPILRRQVWIHAVPPGTPPVDPARRDVGRVGRLHWLTGRRDFARDDKTTAEFPDWDAFEAPDGAPLLSRAATALEWPALKLWLLDLTKELALSAEDGTTPALDLDRLWIRQDGRLVLLDFPAPGAEPASIHQNSGGLTPVALLSAVARRATKADAVLAHFTQMPLSARRLLEHWERSPDAAIQTAREDLVRVAALPNATTRTHRAVPIALASAPIAFILILAAGLAGVLQTLTNSPNLEMVSWLELLARAEPPEASGLREPGVREAMETYVAGRYGSRLTDERVWESRLFQQSMLVALRRTAADISARHPSVSAADLARATTIIGPELERRKARERSRPAGGNGPAAVAASAVGAFATFCVLICVVLGSLAVAGGIVTRLLGLAVVTRDGTEIGRLRSLARVLIAWSPAIVWLAYLWSSPKIQVWVPNPQSPLSWMFVTLALLAAGAASTIVYPARGPHDWLSRTWVVPR